MIPDNQLLELTYELFSRIKDSDFEYVYKGGFSQEMSKKILALAESNVKKSVDRTAMRNKIYFLMIEGLQNVTRHQEKSDSTENVEDGMFAIQKNKDKYFVTTGNIINKDNELILRPKLEQINLLDKEQLKKVHKDILLTGEISDKGGAGLGLVEMARKSGNRLLYDFEPVDKDKSFFYFRTEIPNNTVNESIIPSINDEKSVTDIKGLQSKLDKENIVINFNGKFTRDNILSLLSIIKGHMNVSKSSKKVYNIMVEMLQNISKHTNDVIGDRKNRGIFFLSKKQDQFILTSGNYMQNSHVDYLRNKLEKTNGFNDKELHDTYNDVLMDFTTPDAQKTGLGFIDIRIKSEKPLDFLFKKIDDEVTFFSLQTAVSAID